jgi:hypothetical protein
MKNFAGLHDRMYGYHLPRLRSLQFHARSHGPSHIPDQTQDRFTEEVHPLATAAGNQSARRRRRRPIRHSLDGRPARGRITAARPPRQLAANVRSFGAYTADLHQLADWLAGCGVKTVAMDYLRGLHGSKRWSTTRAATGWRNVCTSCCDTGRFSAPGCGGVRGGLPARVVKGLARRAGELGCRLELVQPAEV